MTRAAQFGPRGSGLLDVPAGRSVASRILVARMRSLGSLAAAFLATGVLAWAAPAAADPMDPAIERLVLNRAACSSGGALTRDATGKAVLCQADNASFTRLAAQYGFAVAPSAMSTARTTGFAGINFSLETSFTKIDKDADYWKNGTRGAQDGSSQRFSSTNPDPDGMLNLYLLKVRKGFPFGFELVANVGWMGHTSMVTGGADIRWSLLEGFRTGFPGFLPDVSFGAGVRTITPAAQFNLTVFGIDGQISKPLPIADSGVLTPSFGYQWTKIYADSGLVDATPATDPLGYCGFSGTNIPGSGVAGNGDPNKKTSGGTPIYDGQPVCQNAAGTHGSAADFNNTFVFDRVRITRQRIFFGLQYRYEVVFVGAQFITDAAAPTSTSTAGANGADPVADMAKQWTLALDVGAAF